MSTLNNEQISILKKYVKQCTIGCSGEEKVVKMLLDARMNGNDREGCSINGFLEYKKNELQKEVKSGLLQGNICPVRSCWQGNIVV